MLYYYILIYREELHVKDISNTDTYLHIYNVNFWHIPNLSTCDSRTEKQTNLAQWNELLFYMHSQYRMFKQMNT